MNCCKEGIHRSCLKEKCPTFVDEKVVLCPKCHVPDSKASAQVIQRSHFSLAEVEKIEQCFEKHHVFSSVPVTKEEMQGLCTARLILGHVAMCHVSHRVFLVGMCFWFKVQKEMVHKWEDIVS